MVHASQAGNRATGSSTVLLGCGKRLRVRSLIAIMCIVTKMHGYMSIHIRD